MAKQWGKYRVVRPIARGGQGATYLADAPDGAEVALKEVDFGMVSDWDRVEMFEREASVLGGLTHPGIPRIIESFQEERRLFLVQQYVDGMDLERRLVAGEQFAQDKLIEFSRQVLDILAYLHAYSPPVVHRDVKPANLVLRDDGELSLVDFGAAQGAQQGESVIGSSGFMAPEQLMGRAVPASDLYGLGATLVRLATRKHPSDLLDGTRLEWRKYANLTSSFSEWVERLVEPAAEDRFGSAMEALRALDKVVHGGAVVRTKSGLPEVVRSYRTASNRYTVRLKGTDLGVFVYRDEPAGDDQQSSVAIDDVLIFYVILPFVLMFAAWGDWGLTAAIVFAALAGMHFHKPRAAILLGSKTELTGQARFWKRTFEIPVDEIAGIEVQGPELVVWRSDGTDVRLERAIPWHLDELEQVAATMRDWLTAARRAQ